PSMPRPYSNDLRARVTEAIEAGASRREATDRYELSPSVVVLWAQRWEQTGSVAAKPSGGSISPLEDHAEFLLALIVEQPDLTLDEIVEAMAKSQAAGAAVGRLIRQAIKTARHPFRSQFLLSYRTTIAVTKSRTTVAEATSLCDSRMP